MYPKTVSNASVIVLVFGSTANRTYLLAKEGERQGCFVSVQNCSVVDSHYICSGCRILRMLTGDWRV